MSIAVIAQFALLSVIAAIGICAVYAMSRTRKVSAGNTNIPEAVQSQTVIEAEPEVQPRQQASPPPGAKPDNLDYACLRREVIRNDCRIRFSVLNDWLSINMLAILRRAFHDWKTVNDLIAIVPSYLEPEAEILDRQVLLIGTRGHSEKLAIPIRELDPSSDLSQYFDFVVNGQTAANTPAVILRSRDGWKLVSKGRIAWTMLLRMDAVHRQRADSEEAYETVCEIDSIIISSAGTRSAGQVARAVPL
jgi:hypothetical protein